MLGNTDKPIEKIENDTFGISSYIDGLSSFILYCDTPMTISIQGDWGSGKTSMMNMIKERISKKVYPIWFNTWQFSQFQMQNELTVSMMCSLLSELDYNKDSIKKIFGFLGGAAKLATGIITEKIAGGYLADEITNAMDGGGVADSASQITELKAKFQDAINEKLKTSKKERVVIFIDDLDRLQPEKAVELLEVLKIFLDCENCVYVLAVDYEVVTQGIKQKFGDSVGEKKGKSFFDKIIQLPFKMPVAQYNIFKYVADMLKNMGIKHSDETVTDYVSLIKLSIGCNPRSVKRLFNTYLLLTIILKNKHLQKFEEDTYKILFGVICLQMEFEQLYKYIVAVSNTLDYDFFIELEGDISANDELKEYIDMTDENELLRISAFIKKFNEVLKINDGSVVDEHIEKLKELLSYSTVTSVNVANEDEDTESKNDFDWHYRYANKNMANDINAKIGELTGYNFRLWQARKNTVDNRISDAWGVLRDKSSDGINFEFDYFLKTDYTVGITSMGLYLGYNRPSTEEDFDALFSKSPLPYRYIREKGKYRYEGIYQFSDSEREKAVGDIVPIIVDALNAIHNL